MQTDLPMCSEEPDAFPNFDRTYSKLRPFAALPFTAPSQLDFPNNQSLPKFPAKNQKLTCYSLNQETISL